MTAELLRRAAERIREAAAGAALDPRAGPEWPTAPALREALGRQLGSALDVPPTMPEHIALWSPPVALAVAAWLEGEARDLAEFSDPDPTRPLTYAARHIHHDFGPAVRAARAVLGEPYPT